VAGTNVPQTETFIFCVLQVATTAESRRYSEISVENPTLCTGLLLYLDETERYSKRLMFGSVAMSNLDFLIERAREYRKQYGFSEEEQDRQVRSFAYGNTRLENDRITMVDIDRAMESLRTERDPTEPVRRS